MLIPWAETLNEINAARRLVSSFRHSKCESNGALIEMNRIESSSNASNQTETLTISIEFEFISPNVTDCAKRHLTIACGMVLPLLPKHVVSSRHCHRSRTITHAHQPIHARARRTLGSRSSSSSMSSYSLARGERITFTHTQRTRNAQHTTFPNARGNLVCQCVYAQPKRVLLFSSWSCRSCGVQKLCVFFFF